MRKKKQELSAFATKGSNANCVSAWFLEISSSIYGMRAYRTEVRFDNKYLEKATNNLFFIFVL